MLDITKIKEVIDEIILKEKIDRKDLLDDGAVFYYNGNDLTDFDYKENGRTCEFYVFNKKTGYGKIKLVQKGKFFEVMVYSEDDSSADPKEYKIESPFNLYELCNYLYGTFDSNDIYNQKIENWLLTEKYNIVNNWDDDDWNE